MQKRRTTDNELSTSENTTLDLKHMSHSIVLQFQKQRKEERLLNLISLPHITLKQMFKTKNLSLLSSIYSEIFYYQCFVIQDQTHKQWPLFIMHLRKRYCNFVPANLSLTLKTEQNKMQTQCHSAVRSMGCVCLCVCVQTWLPGFRRS